MSGLVDILARLNLLSTEAQINNKGQPQGIAPT